MNTDTLDLPPITGIEPTAATQVPAVTASTDVAVPDKTKVRDAALAPLVALTPSLQIGRAHV